MNKRLGIAGQSISESKPSKRRLRTRTLARFSDSLARYVITAGGVGTILVALMIVVVLILQLIPLARKTHVELVRTIPLATNSGTSETIPQALGIDEYGDLCWVLYNNREIRVFELKSGRLLRSFEDPRKHQAKVTCFSIAEDCASLLIGCEDGSTQVIELTISTDYRDTDQTVSMDSRVLDEPMAKVVTTLGNGLDRVQSIDNVIYREPESVFTHPVRNVDWVTPKSVFGLDHTKSWSWAASDGRSLLLVQVHRQRLGLSQNVREDRREWRSAQSGLNLSGLMVNARGDQVTTVDETGLVQRWEERNQSLLVPSASHWSISGSDSRISTSSPLLGRNTLLIGCESGFVEAVSSSQKDNQLELLSIHRIGASHSKVVQLDTASNARVIAVGYDDGTKDLFYVPSNRLLARWKSSPQHALSFSANSKLIGALRSESVDVYRIEAPFPESGWSSLFGTIWYEGYDEPTHMWQSSTGTSQGEPKFGLLPLVFGTLKATFYSILIAAPIGFFAALFASEWLSQTTRIRIKPAIELMSSVPSVALGYMGAMVVAPLLRESLFAVLVGVPISFLLLWGARLLWELVPTRFERGARRMRVVAFFGTIMAGFWLSLQMGGALEQLCFGGSIHQWLAGEVGNAWIGWLVLILPISSLLVWWIESRLREGVFFSENRRNVAQMGLRYLVIAVSIVGLASLVAGVATMLGFDPRGTLFGTYQERNALLVGVILGFAIIPLIYSLSEDALQAVPQHLRSASMSCGATPWQTTVRIVIPSAVSGLFGALMLGLGRAIGETMVVLMVAGNTPIMEWNPFSGYRTLAATLATELPEAARGSTHYHTLFAAAGVLFCLTILVNSLAEVVRLHVRKRSEQL